MMNIRTNFLQSTIGGTLVNQILSNQNNVSTAQDTVVRQVAETSFARSLKSIDADVFMRSH